MLNQKVALDFFKESPTLLKYDWHINKKSAFSIIEIWYVTEVFSLYFHLFIQNVKKTSTQETEFHENLNILLTNQTLTCFYLLACLFYWKYMIVKIQFGAAAFILVKVPPLLLNISNISANANKDKRAKDVLVLFP